jgi:lysophospholipase L1-like esterase
VYLGDSITDITCWRSMVWEALAKENLADSVQMVGSMTSNPSNCKPPSGFDGRHEGHSGWKGTDIANDYIEKWAKDTPADIVNFMLGTNDVSAKRPPRSTQDIIDAYSKIVLTMRGQVPTASFIVDQLILLPNNSAPVDALNKAIPLWAEAANKPTSPVVVADCSSQAGYTAAMLRDGIHPNTEGDQFIAKAISAKLIPLVKERLAAKANKQ